MTYQISACRSCGQPIFWVKTLAREGKPSKAMPVDADAGGDPVEYPDGNLVRTGAIESNGAPVVQYRTGGPGWKSHFAGCPERDRWRRK